MAKYLLDTNIISYLEDQASPCHQAVAHKVSTLGVDAEVCISILSFYELQFSVSRANDKLKEDILKSVATIQEVFTIIPLGGKIASFRLLAL